MTFVFGLDFGLALLAALLLVRKSPRGAGDSILIAAAAVSASICGGAAMLDAGVRLPPTLAIWVGGSGFIVLPALLFLYVRRQTATFRVYDGLWLVPAVLHTAWLARVWHAHGGLSTRGGFVSLPPHFEAAVPSIVPVLIGIAAPIASLQTLHGHRQRMRAYWTEIGPLDLDWAAKLQIGTLVGSTIAVGALIAFEAQPRLALLTVMLIVGAQLGAFCVFAPAQRAIPPQRAEPVDAVDTSELIPIETLTAAVVASDRFRAEGYSLAVAAEDLGGVDPKRISASLAAAGTGFYDFINGLRVERVCALLTQPAFAQRSVLELAFEAGFQSKATFYRAFKARTGMTPSRYRRVAARPGERPRRRYDDGGSKRLLNVKANGEGPKRSRCQSFARPSSTLGS